MPFSHWHAKLAAWTHDPPEKALILMRTAGGHEGGTVRALQEALFGAAGIPEALAAHVRRADHWAAAADRPQWPREAGGGRYPAWEQVRFAETPVLIHPLSAEQYQIEEKLSEIDPDEIREISTRHFRELILPEGAGDGEVDAKRTALAFWRFGPQLDDAKLRSLWSVLPADSRVPDHTIWTHLDLAAAFATCFHADTEGNPALLAVSFGPVQDFIVQARTTSDLWAGSHLLSRIAWEGLRLICDELGPDCVLFPQLRGVPLVDLWLREEMQIPAGWFEGEDWTTAGTDANPLFGAALPNRFVALVPADRAPELAQRLRERVRGWVRSGAEAALAELVRRSGKDTADLSVAREQIGRQLDGFPEVHWACVPWAPLVRERDHEVPDTEALAEALGAFHPEGGAPGFLGSGAWKLLSRELVVEGTAFYTPNPGVLYPAVYELLDRLQAAAKSVREFAQSVRAGYRCSLCGEREWLTHDRALLELPPGKRQGSGSLWDRVQESAWARKGEHLCAPCTLKRLWPTLFVREVAPVLGAQPPARYVVSTHTMALATTLWRWMHDENGTHEQSALSALSAQLEEADRVALPGKIAKALRRDAYPEPVRRVVERLPGFLDRIREESDADIDDERLGQAGRMIEELIGRRPEAYYALILMDGDRLGAWLSGSDEALRLSFEATWHPQLKAALANRHREGDLAAYLTQRRPVSPARHVAVSAALNAFALHFAREVVEEFGKGKLIYAGGDDVLAMVPIDDLLEVLFLLRLAYSGVFPTGERGADCAWDLLGGDGERLDVRRGHVRFKGRLHRVMGYRATASAGAVVAHHQAPLGHVLRKLRQAEQRAKSAGGRDAFAITLLKRSGGAVDLTCPWLPPGDDAEWSGLTELDATPMGQLIRLRRCFAGETFSRRAAYLTEGWLEEMPEDPEALRAMLAHQFRRQTRGGGKDRERMQALGRSLAGLASAPGIGYPPKAFVRNFLAVAEFLGREGRVAEAGPAPVTQDGEVRP